ncbi:MAG TPA: hypothetical protein DCM38_01510, partial [Gammaproteobacteria bacterium]|nr:hypothetical protein [Gammaproteobacteria bacterium]
MKTLSLIIDEVINHAVHFKNKRWRNALAQGVLLSGIGLSPLISSAATIQDSTFRDNNHNGILDAGEPSRSHSTLSAPPNTLKVLLQGNGTITSSPGGINCGSDCDQQYIPNTSIILTATPDKDYVFVSWSGACQSETAGCTVNMSTDQNVTATFDYSPEDILTVSKTALGSVTPNVGKVPLQVDLEASQSRVPDGRIFNYQWASSEAQKTSGQRASLTLAVIDSYGEKGTTEKTEVTLTVKKQGTGNGTITGIGIDCGSDCTENYLADTSVTLTAKPDNEATFVGWSG